MITLDEVLRQADALEDQGEFARSVALLTEAIERQPDSAVAYHRRGWARAHLGDIQGEIEDWTRAIELDPDFDRAYADRAVARTAARDVAGALDDAQRAVALDDKNHQALGPLLDRLRERLERGLLEERPAADLVATEAHGVDRRQFVRNLAGAAVATAALAHAGCTDAPASGERRLRWGMIIDLRRCVGCRACTIACKAENHTPPGVAYNVVLEHEEGTFPNVTRRFLPRPCQQCSSSSCTQVCPTKATYHRPDGVVVVDYDRCIGCRYCLAACPYGARSFDFGHNYAPELTPHERRPSPEYGQHRQRTKRASPIGNVRKCTFCIHRVTNGLNPACAETCIGRAIHFGDLNDPEAVCRLHGEKLRHLLSSRSHMRLKEELGNDPSVYYLT